MVKKDLNYKQVDVANPGISDFPESIYDLLVRPLRFGLAGPGNLVYGRGCYSF